MRGIFALCLLPAVLARPLEFDHHHGPGIAPHPTGTAPAPYSTYSGYSCSTHGSYGPWPTVTSAPYPTAWAGFKHYPHFDLDSNAQEGRWKRFEGARKYDSHGPWLPYEPESNHHPHPYQHPHPHEHPHPHPGPTGTGVVPTGTGTFPSGPFGYPFPTGVAPTGTPHGYHPLPTYFLDGLRHEAGWSW